MSIISSVGISSGEDSYTVGANACQMAYDKIGDAKPKMVIVFASSQYDQEKMLAGVRSVSGPTPLAGCSTAGEITTEGPAKKHSVVVMAIDSDQIRFYPVLTEGAVKNPREAGAKLGELIKAKEDPELKILMIMPDSLNGNGAQVLHGVLDVLGKHFPVVGGSPGDDQQFKKTFQYLDDKVYSGAVLAIGLAGKFKMGVGVKHGWIPIGKHRKVTKAEGTILYELDGQPAINIYRDYFGQEEADNLKKESFPKFAITYPLGMQLEGNDDIVIRDPIAVDDNGSLICGGEIVDGSDIRLVVGSHEDAVKAGNASGKMAMEQLAGAKPKAILLFECMSRHALSGDRAWEEIESIQQAVGKDVPLLGFYTYGEQAPINGEVQNLEKCNSAFHNKTAVILALAE